MTIFRYGKVYDFASKQKIVLIVTALVSVYAIFLMLTKTPNYGIDFTGGTVVQVRYSEKAPIDEIRNSLSGTMFSDAQIQEFGSDKEIVIKAPASTTSLGQDVGDEMHALLNGTGDFEIRRVDMVGARAGDELRTAGTMAVIISFIGILIYITLRFEWRFAIAAVLATMHDLIFVVGFVILFQVPINLDILAGMLTILGYSLNDTIVIFDRIRDTLNRQNSTATLDQIINESISLTLSRTTLTSLTTLFVVTTTYMFGGELLKPLSLVLIVGIVIATISSIFVAVALLRLFKFDIGGWKAREARKIQLRAEKDKMRAMYEKGTI